MAEKVKLNKNSLRDQKQALELYQEFLPTLELRKQQLQTEVRSLRKEIKKKQEELQRYFDSARSWASLLQATMESISPLVRKDEVVTHTGNVAGVRVPVFDKVTFHHEPYSLVATDPYYDDAVDFWKNAIGLREELDVMEEQLRLLQQELTKTTQRINLYEKVLIPQTRENIKKIQVFLGDQQTAQVCRAKAAKAKLEKKAKKAERISAQA